MINMEGKPYANHGYNFYKINNFNSFYVIRDNVFGDKSLCVIIPFAHYRDGSPSSIANMNRYLSKKDIRHTFVVSKKVLAIFTGPIRDLYPNKNKPQLNAAIDVINKYQSLDFQYRIPNVENDV